jgi:two-component system, chemotaxis family, chemotaxis protein CheY
MKMLVMEDEFVSRSIIMEILSPYGEVEAAENGREALEKFQAALQSGKRFDVIFLDIMVPEMSGQDVLKNIREMEQQHGVSALVGVKVVMTTALGDFANVKAAFKHQCEAYLIKPIDREKVISTLEGLGVIS